MSLFSNIIRGGQLSLHALRMFKQVFNILFYWSLSVSVLAFSWKAYKDITLVELETAGDRLLSEFLVSLGFKDTTINIRLSDGSHLSLKSGFIATDYYIESVNKRFLKKLETSGYFALQAFIVFFILLTIFFIWKGFKSSGVRLKRGARFESFKIIKKQIKARNKKKRYKAYSLAGLPYPTYGEMQHTLVIGANGVGKTVLISELVEEIRKRGDRAIIYDKKCDYIKWFYDESRDYILNPFDKRGENWNILGEIQKRHQIKPLSEAFIPKVQGNQDDIWNEAARIAFSAILEKLLLEKKDLSHKDIVDSILKKDMKELSYFLKDTVARNIIDPSSPKTAASVLFVLASRFNSLKLTEGTQETSFSIKRWIREKENSFLFFTSKAEYLNELSSLQTAFFEIAIGSLLSEENRTRRKTWIILDELASLQKIPSLAKGLSLGRSYGACFVLGLQNISQMREIYGRNTTESLSSECHNRCVFKANDPDTAKWIVANLGEAEVTEFKEGLSYGAHNMRDGINVNTQDRVHSLLLPSEIQNLERLHLYLKMVDFPAVKTQLSYKERGSEAEGFIEKQSVLDVMDHEEPLESEFLRVKTLAKDSSLANQHGEKKDDELSGDESLDLAKVPHETSPAKGNEDNTARKDISFKDDKSLSLNTGKNVTTLLSSKFFKRRHDNA